MSATSTSQDFTQTGPKEDSARDVWQRIREISAERRRAEASFLRTVEHLIVRTVEIVLGSVVLIVTAPVMLIVAIIIKLDTPGPALFRQVRVTRDGVHFNFYKFRTLYADARERFPELYAYRYSAEEVQKLQVKREEDPRITPAGRWLRKTTLDELPNFWNLVCGEVALVGPRPEIPELVVHYTDAQLVKFSVRPGITGLAQTSGRGRLAFQQTIAYDVEYVNRKSLWLDIKLIFRTLKVLTDGSF